MKRILVPTDFSEYAEDAVKVAAEIAKKNNSEIFLLHILELPLQISNDLSDPNAIPEEMLFIKKANEKFQKIKESPYLNGITIHKTVQSESNSDGILSFSKKNNIDLIIMGSRGSSGIEEILIGSNTEKIVRLSDIPVLTIKKDVNKFEGKNFVFASDFSKEAKKPFEKMIEFTKIFDANLFLVMICTPNNFKTTLISEKIMSDFIADFDIQNHSLHVFNDTNVENGIINFANTINADLIGLCTHGRTGLSHFFNGSISEDLVNHTAKPVITFKI